MAHSTLKPSTHDARVLFLDATRGIMMLVVFLAHFGRVYFRSVAHELLPSVIQRGTMSASPTFMIVSGLMLGFLWRSRPDQFGRVKTKLIDRGLFLLTAGHVIITVAHLILSGTPRWLFITDTIGFSMIVGVSLIDVLTARARLIVSALVYAAGWAAIAWLHPVTVSGRALMDTLVGSPAAPYYEYSFPLLPWFALYFASTVLGEQMAVRYREGDTRSLIRTFAKMSLAGLTAAAVIKVVFLMVTVAGPARESGVLSMLAGVFQKTPPSPAYILFNGGLGFGLLALLCAAEQWEPCHRLVARAGVLGQSSLFLFVMQYYVYYAGLFSLHLAVTSAWPLVFAATAALIVVPGIVYQRLGGNRLLTVGYPAIRAALDRRVPISERPSPSPYTWQPQTVRREM